MEQVLLYNVKVSYDSRTGEMWVLSIFLWPHVFFFCILLLTVSPRIVTITIMQ